MTALLLPGLAVLGAVSITLSALAVCLPGCAYAFGRLRRRARRAYTDWTLSKPPVPQQDSHWCDYGDCPKCAPVPDTDEDWLSVPPLVFPADVTLAELEQAALAHDFTEIIRREFPQYRSFRDAA